MKKHIINLCFLGGFSIASLAQDANWNLESVLGTEKYQSIPQENLEFMNFVNAHGFYTQDMNEFNKDISEYPNALEIAPRSQDFATLTAESIASGFPLYAYDFPIRDKHYGYYRIGDTGVLFIIYPLELSRVLYERQNANEND